MKASVTLLKTVLLSIASFGISCGVHAQDSSSLDGRWNAELNFLAGPVAGRTFAGFRLTLNGKTGSWEVLNQVLTGGGNSNPDAVCTNLKTPIEVVQPTVDTLRFDVLRSKLIRGCADYRHEYKLVDGKLIGEVFLLGPGGDQLIAKAVATRPK